MVGKRSEIAGFIAGGAILSLGLALIFAKDWVWSLFESLYAVLGIHAERTRLWEMFITTIGLGVLIVGLYALGAAWQRRRLDN